MTLTKVHRRGGRHGLLLKARPDAGRMITVAYLPTRDELQVTTVTPRRTAVLRRVTVSLDSGDRLEARALGDGKVRVLANGVRVAQADAGARFAGGGYIGAHFSKADRARFDDYTGGLLR
jgi:hypothetical protein